MYKFHEQIDKLLTDEDREILSRIYEPTVMTVPPGDAYNKLCIMHDGRIRSYGEYGKRHAKDFDGCRICYIESCDAGLTWKLHLTKNNCVVGASTYIPSVKKYMCARYVSEEMLGTYGYEQVAEAGTYIAMGESPDDEHPKYVLVSKEKYMCFRLPYYADRNDSIIVVCHKHKPGIHRTMEYPFVFVSKDGGKSWTVTEIGLAPLHEKVWPHKGYRWIQGNIEDTIVERSDGSLLLHARTCTDYFYRSVSYDGGVTWAELERTDFHATQTMPVFKGLSDGRILFFWCNTKPLPEMAEADGVWEDVFTNRDANHCAISEDDGATWRGFREILLNPARCAADFRTCGTQVSSIDKSTHQFEAVELPMNKILLLCGQNKAVRRIMIFDLNWLYEKERHESFLSGLDYLSTQSYVHSILGGFHGQPGNEHLHSGHCAYNRVSGALLLPSPEDEAHEVLHIASSLDDRLISPICGAVWNFPVTKKGRVTVRARIGGSGVRASLLDFWMNPCDPTVTDFANHSIVLRPDMHPEGEEFSDFVFDFDCECGTVVLSCGDYLRLERRLQGEYPNGLCYLHLQSVHPEDTVGGYIARMDFVTE